MAGLAEDVSIGHYAAEDDRTALEAFFMAHHGRLLRLAGLVCGDLAAAEDIVQTALERAWRSRGSIADDARLRPWLDRIVVREAARERRTRLIWLDRLIHPPTVTEIGVSERDHVDEAAGRFPERFALRQALAALSIAQRAVVVLHLHAGYTLDETAGLLGIPRETVRSRLRVAREQLRVVLGEAGVMDRRLSDEQLDRAVIRILAEQGAEIEASGITPAGAAARVRLGPAHPLA